MSTNNLLICKIQLTIYPFSAVSCFYIDVLTIPPIIPQIYIKRSSLCRRFNRVNILWPFRRQFNLLLETLTQLYACGLRTENTNRKNPVYPKFTISLTLSLDVDVEEFTVACALVLLVSLPFDAIIRHNLYKPIKLSACSHTLKT